MRILTLLLTLAMACSACASSTPAADPPRESLDRFPHSTLTINRTGGARQFEVWVADTNTRRAQGLMFVKQLPQGKGMLFLFEPPQPVSMWMKNTLIPLDMLFIDAGGRIIRIAERTKPKSLDSIPSMGLTAAVLELAGGECARLGIQAGDRVLYGEFSRSQTAPRP